MSFMGQVDEEKEEKLKKIIKISIIFAVIALFIVLGVYMYVYYKDSQTLKTTVDGKQVKMPEGIYIFEDTGKIYVSIEQFGKLVGYNYYRGEYGKFNEDTSQCYLQNKNEVAGFELGSNKLYKLNPNSDSANYEWYVLDEPIKIINNKMYCTSDSIKTACNVTFKYNQEKNRIQIMTLENLVSNYQEIAMNKYGYNGIDTSFENQKAILYNMIVVKKTETDDKGKEKKDSERYGVITLDNKTLIGTKYNKIQFIEGMQEFFVTSNEKVGILSSEGAQKIDLNYDKISLLDNELKLYYVVNNNLKGVVDRNGKRIVYLEFEQIGIDAKNFKSNNITNNMLLFDNAIPVMKNSKWGLFDKNGNQILEPIYDSLGYIAGNTKDTAENNLLIIPQIEGIVICKDKKYGIVDSTGRFIAPCEFDKIYSITNLGKDTFYLVYGTQTITLEDYQKLNNPQSENEKAVQETTNNQSNVSTQTNAVVINQTTTQVNEQEVQNAQDNQTNATNSQVNVEKETQQEVQPGIQAVSTEI